MLNKFLLFIMISASAVGQTLNDPTRPAQFSAPSKHTESKGALMLQLEAIMRTGQQRRAVISGQVVAEGQQVLGAVVKAIHASQVEIVQQVNGEWVQQTLSVAKSGNVKSNAAENY